MRLKLQKNIFYLAEIIHLRIFGHSMSDEMRKFLGNLSWSFFGGIIAAGIMFVVSVLAGRYLGPEEYGKYNAILSFATILSTIYLFGIDVSSVRYISDRKYVDLTKKIFTTSFLSVIFVQLTLALILFFTQRIFFDIIGLSSEFLFFGLLLAITISLKTLLNGFLRAFHEFRKQSAYRVLDAGLVFLGFFTLTISYGQQNASSYAYSFLFGGVSFVVFSLWNLRRNFTIFDFSLLKKIFSEYNQYVLILSLIGIALASDKLIIGKFLGFRELGYYSAYYAASHLFVAELGGIFMNVFWPSVIKNVGSIPEIVRKTVRLFINLSLVWITLIGVSVFVLISLFGSGYPLRYDYLLLFSVNAYLGFLFSIFAGFLNVSHIQRGVAVFGLFMLISLAALLFSKSIVGYLFAQIIAQICLIWYMKSFLLKPDKMYL